MIDVFPTPWSPKKTSLYLASGEIFGADADGVEAAVLLDAAIDPWIFQH